jgi:predicted permease
MLIQLLPLLLICILGAALKRWGLLQPHDTQPLSRLLTTLALPAVILKALTTATITPDLIYLPMAALIVVMGLTLISLGAAYWLKGDRTVVGALVTAFPTFEGGGVGYPLMLLTFGEVGLSRLVLFDLAQAIYLLTVVYCLSAWFGAAGVTLGTMVRSLARTPFFWAIAVGLVFNALGLRPPLLLNTLDIAGNSFLLLVLLLLGMEFQVTLSSIGYYMVLAGAKIGLGLGLGWLVSEALGLGGLEQTAVIVGASLPPSMLTLIFAREHHLDTRAVISFISVAVPLYLVVISFVLG